MEHAINNLINDSYIYPRGNKSNSTINSYKDAIEAGAEFPSIIIQCVTNYKNGNEEPTDATLIIDGVHRWEASRLAGKATIETEYWLEEVLDYEEWKIRLALLSAELNTKHGDRLKEADKKSVARRIAEDDTKITENEIAGHLTVSQQTINNWISDIRARQRSSRDAQVYRLSLLGWTQQDIADKFGMARSTIAEIVGNTNIGISDNLEKGKTMEEIAEFYQIDLALAWAIRMQGKDDRERFRSSDEKKDESDKPLDPLLPWDIWSWNECDKRFGDDWPGRIPAQLVAHTLYFFTNKGDLVLDPMAGGGVVPDVCLLFERKCQAFDVNTRENRPEIKEHYWDLDGMRWPETKKPDLIFFDPPYYTKMDEDYQEKAGDLIPLSSLPREDYLDFFYKFFILAKHNSKTTTRLAFLNADWRDYQGKSALDESPENDVTMLDYAAVINSAGWTITHIIDCPLPTEQMRGSTVKKYQDERTIGVLRRTLFICKPHG